MEISYIKEFIDLTETLNFEESAYNMNISTSALSKHIRKLEGELGVSLFDRSTKKTSLNHYGSIFLKYALEYIKLDEACSLELLCEKNKNENQINIGFLPMLDRFGILDIVFKFQSLYPDIHLNLSESYCLQELLKEKKFDFIFDDAYKSPSQGIQKILLKKDHMSFIIPPSHPLARNTSVSLEMVKDENFILQSYDKTGLTFTSQRFVNACLEKGFSPKISQTANSIGTIIQIVEHENVLSVLNESELTSEINHQCHVSNIDPPISFCIFLSYIPEYIHSKNKEMFVNYVKKSGSI